MEATLSCRELAKASLCCLCNASSAVIEQLCHVGWAWLSGPHLEGRQLGGVVGGDGSVQLVAANSQGGEVGWQRGWQWAGELVVEGCEAAQVGGGGGIEAGRDGAGEAGVADVDGLEGSQAAERYTRLLQAVHMFS